MLSWAEMQIIIHKLINLCGKKILNIVYAVVSFLEDNNCVSF